MEILKVEMWGDDIYKVMYVAKSDWNSVKITLDANSIEYLVIDSFSVLGTLQAETLIGRLKVAA